jgi:hypothetical protein
MPVSLWRGQVKLDIVWARFDAIKVLCLGIVHLERLQ